MEDRDYPSFLSEYMGALERDGDPGLAGLDDEELERRVRVGASEIAAATCRWLELLAELVVRGIWSQQGAKSPSQWLSWAISMGESTAREHVRVALRLPCFPEVTRRFRTGELSYSQVRAITRLDRPELEGLLIQFAEHATGSQLDRIVRDFRSTDRIAGSDRPSPFERRHVSWTQPDHEMVEITIRLPVDDGLRAVATLRAQAERAATTARQTRSEIPRPDAAGDAHGDGRASAEAPPSRPTFVPISARLADAFIEATEVLAASGPVDTSGADRDTLVLHVDGDELVDPDPPVDRIVTVEIGGSSGRRRVKLSASTLRRLACQAGYVLVGHGEQPGISGRTRRIPPRLRRAMLARDRTCRFPGCDATRRLDGHHIVERADLGPTELPNLLTLCSYHHTFVHEHGWTILHDGRGHVRFAPPGQDPLPTRRPLPRASAEARVGTNPTGDPKTLQPSWDGTPPDYDACVAALQDELERLQAPSELLAA